MIPRNLYDSDHEMFRDSLRKFLEVEAMPHHEQWAGFFMPHDPGRIRWLGNRFSL